MISVKLRTLKSHTYFCILSLGQWRPPFPTARWEPSKDLSFWRKKSAQRHRNRAIPSSAEDWWRSFLSKWRQSDVTCPLQKCCVHDMRKYCHSNKLYASTFGGLFSLKTVHLFDMRIKNSKIILFHRLTLIILWKSSFQWFWVQ